MKLTAIVPIKSNSTRIPEKNFQLFNKKPLFHSILQTLEQVDSIETVVVNTDSEIVKRDCSLHFKKVKILDRPEHLRANEITMNTLIAHDIRQISGEHFLQTHCTNPLLSSKTIQQAIHLYISKLNEYDSLFTVDKVQKRIFGSNGEPLNHNPEVMLQTQDLDPIYIENSNLFLFSRESFLKSHNRIGQKPQLLPMSLYESVDIDYPEDFALAEIILQHKELFGFHG